MHKEIKYSFDRDLAAHDPLVVEELSESLLNGYIDRDQFDYVNDYAPQLLTNRGDRHIFDDLQSELRNCDGFTFSVAFITEELLTMLKTTLADLAERGVQGRILTSNYLNFNHPKVFKDLQKIPNIETRLVRANGFHQKGYIFDHADRDLQTVIIGSANLTKNALLTNYEWNLRISSLENGDITHQVSREIESSWEQATDLTDEWIANYEQAYQEKPSIQYIIRQEKTSKVDQLIKPNTMQQEALDQLQVLRQRGEHKGLVISATGTGKTYLGAFDVQQYRPKRFLYVIHREQILQKTKDSFQRILGGDDRDYGIFTGGRKVTDAKYQFATIQSLAKPDQLANFAPDEFDYILFDEAHHVGGETYQRVINYFHADFMLGMTATPERSDEFNVFQQFNYNIAYEIRLQQALEEDMLCPFHYIGVEDYEFDGDVISDMATLSRLVSPERVKYIIKQTQYYGYSGNVLRGLIFCSQKEEAYDLAAELTKQGFPSIGLTGSDSEARRNEVVSQLEDGKINYIVTVDIFNEGIDIPSVNQVVMLRNTKSSIVFVQQLGRGLRKAPNKDYVVVIDFIGNYRNNYLIPIALTGDDSRMKDSARQTIELEPMIGVSTINFTRVAKERIYESIQVAKLTGIRELKQIYLQQKERLNRIPLMYDFQYSHSIDERVFARMKGKKTGAPQGSYYAFLTRVEPGKFNLSDYEAAVLRFLTNEICTGIRQHELLVIDYLLTHDQLTDQEFAKIITDHHLYLEDDTLASVQRVLSLEYYGEKTHPSKYDYGELPVVEYADEAYRLGKAFSENYRHHHDFHVLVQDAIKTGLLRAKRYDSTQVFTLYQRYTRSEIIRLMNFEKDIPKLNIGGYKIEGHRCPIFVTYEKPDDISATTDYNDEFYNNREMSYFSKSNRTRQSKDVQAMTGYDENGEPLLEMKLFLKQSADEGDDFMFLSQVRTIPQSVSETTQGGKPVVKFILKLDSPVENRRYHRIIGK